MLSLKMVSDSPYVPVFDNAKAYALAKACVAADSIKEVVRLLREAAEPIEQAKPVYNVWKKANIAGMSWKECFNQLADALELGKARFKIFEVKGNTKLPFVSFSALPFFTCPGMGECETFCYSKRAWRYAAAFARQLQNTLLLKFFPNLIKLAFARIKPNMAFRLYVDGDFDSLESIAFWMDLLKTRPDIRAYGYSKSWELIAQYDKQINGAWPANYRLNLSSGGAIRSLTVADMLSLRVTRGEFIALNIDDYKPKDKDGKAVKGNIGFKRYDDPEYHRAVRRAAKRAGMSKVFSCPGKCGECNPNGHVCGGGGKFEGITVVIGVH